MTRVFISHSHADNGLALALGQWLEYEGWSDYFLDIHPTNGLSAAGESWSAALYRAIDRCEAVLFLISHDWIESRECYGEFRDAKNLGKHLFGVKVGPVKIEEIRPELAEKQLCDLTRGQHFRRFEVCETAANGPAAVSLSVDGLNCLRVGLKKAGLDASTFIWPPAADPDRSPYPGLRALDAADAGVFFGRDALIVRAIDRIRLARERGVEQVFAILGASGAGKSSFLRAGLLPRLQRDTDRFVVLPVVRPERAILEGTNGFLASLKDALIHVGRPKALSEIRALVEHGECARLIEEIAISARDASDDSSAPGDASRHVVIPIDQAEELFSEEGRIEAEQFLAVMESLRGKLASLREGPGASRSGILILLAIRTDAFSRLQQQAFAQQPSPLVFSLPAMPAFEFKSIIEGPARRHTQGGHPCRLTPELAEQLALDAQAVKSLPLLAMTLESLYREYNKGEKQKLVLDIDQYRRLGEMGAVIGKSVERALANPSAPPAIPKERDEISEVLNRIFPLLASSDPESKCFKRRVAVRDSFRAIPHADAVIARLIDQRLLESDARRLPGGTTDVEVVEVAHEALFVQWKAFDRWLHDYAGSLTMLEMIRRAAGEWWSNGQDSALLVHTDHRLATAEALLDDDRISVLLKAEDRAYLAACHKRDLDALQERKLNVRQRRWFVAALAIGSTVGLVFLSLAIMEKRDSARQRSLSLAMSSEAAVEQGDFEQGMRLGVLATRKDWLQPPDERAVQRLNRAADGNTAQILLPHQAAVRTVSFSNDGRLALTTSDENAAHLYDARTGSSIGGPMKHSAAIRTVAFSPDGRHVATSSADDTVRIWDSSTAKESAGPIQHAGVVRSVRFSADGLRIVTASEDQTARVWNVADGSPVTGPLDHQGIVLAADFVADGKQIVTVSNHSIRLWNAESGAALGTAMTSAQNIVDVSFCSDGSRLVTILGKSAQVWDLERRAVATETIEHEGPIRYASFSRDCRTIVTASDDGTAKLWIAASGLPVDGSLTMRHSDQVLFATFSADGRLIVTASSDHTAQLWDARGRPIGDPMPHRGVVNYADFSEDGAYVITASDDRTARIWEVAQLRNRAGPPMVHEARITSAAFSPDGKLVVTSSVDGRARLWDARTGVEIGGTPPRDGPLLTAIFDPDARHITTAADDGTVGRWAVVDQKPSTAPLRLAGRFLAMRFCRDGLRVATTSEDDKVLVRDGLTGKPLGPPIQVDSRVLSADIALDGQSIITGSAFREVVRWRVRDGRRIGDPMIREAPVNSVNFSQDGRFVLSASLKTTRIWDLENNSTVGKPRTHPADVPAARFSRDGRRVVIASLDHEARVWDVKTGLPLGEPRVSADGVTAVNFSPDGRYIVTASIDGAARVWSVLWSSYDDRETLRHAVCMRMSDDARRITEADSQLASVIARKQIGEDVCADVARSPR
ncbi:MAG: TIR domain-containing protein [Burkholderiaceae bacterium]